MNDPTLVRPLLVIGASMWLACRGDVSQEPPVHVVLDMDRQPRYEAQDACPECADHGAMRAPVVGTVAVGRLRADAHTHRATAPGGALADALPPAISLDVELLRRGRDRYEIFCVPCHDVRGTGVGLVVERGMMQPPSLHERRLREQPLGYFFAVMSDGLRNMPAHASQIPTRDRWTITAYVRALQIAHDPQSVGSPAATTELEAGGSR
jgi:hypothetical protein